MQDELLYTMALDLAAYNSAAISFWNESFAVGHEDEGTVITLEISDDVAKATWTPIWTYPDPGWIIEYHWYQKTLDLSEYTGNTIWIGWRYVFDGVSHTKGHDYYLDDVLITADCTGCQIAGICYEDGDTNPDNVCVKCDIASSQNDWTSNDGVACDDGFFCNGADSCFGGACFEHAGDPCEEGTECNEDTDSCDPLVDDDDDDDDDVVDDDDDTAPNDDDDTQPGDDDIDDDDDDNDDEIGDDDDDNDDDSGCCS